MSTIGRRHLDERFNQLRKAGPLGRPPAGWIKALRECLGMTTRHLAIRMGVSQARITTLENQEIKGTLKIETLEKVALALDCQLVYVLIPNQPLDAMVENQLQAKAQALFNQTRQTMGLESQTLNDADLEALRNAIVAELRQAPTARLWD